jgi:hypothetical protein
MATIKFFFLLHNVKIYLFFATRNTQSLLVDNMTIPEQHLDIFRFVHL